MVLPFEIQLIHINVECSDLVFQLQWALCLCKPISILSKMLALSGTMSIVLVEKRSHLRDTRFLDCREDSHRLNFFSLHHRLSLLMKVLKGVLRPISNIIYTFPPFAHSLVVGSIVTICQFPLEGRLSIFTTASGKSMMAL